MRKIVTTLMLAAFAASMSACAIDLSTNKKAECDKPCCKKESAEMKDCCKAKVAAGEKPCCAAPGHAH